MAIVAFALLRDELLPQVAVALRGVGVGGHGDTSPALFARYSTYAAASRAR